MTSSDKEIRDEGSILVFTDSSPRGGDFRRAASPCRPADLEALLGLAIEQGGPGHVEADAHRLAVAEAVVGGGAGRELLAGEGLGKIQQRQDFPA